MADLNPDDVAPPIVVSSSATGAQAGSGARDVLLIVSVLPALMAVLGTRDVTKIVAYISSVEFAPTLGLLVAGGTVVWRQWIARRNHAEKKVLATEVPDSKAIVK